MLAVRDTAAWLRWATAADGNPCAGALQRAYLFGVSQSGRFLRQMLHLGLLLEAVIAQPRGRIQSIEFRGTEQRLNGRSTLAGTFRSGK